MCTGVHVNAKKERQHFITEAWPQCVPVALQELSKTKPDEVVSFQQEFGNKLECSGIKAFEYVAEIEIL